MKLAELTTLRVGGPAARVVTACETTELIDAVRAADDASEPVLLVAGGSNLLVSDDGFPGTVILVRSQGIRLDDASACGGATVTVAAGHSWDALVEYAIGQEWAGVEALSGIPGAVGSTPIQNVGAYGQEVSQTIASVRTWDRQERRIRTLHNIDCRFSYRHSLFKADPTRYVVLEVTFQFRHGNLSASVAYAELARALGVSVGERAPLAAVREAVVGLRRGKGMVLDDADHDTWSAGSFFTNPIVPAAVVLPEGAPVFAAGMDSQGQPLRKTSAAWLIEHAGYGKGFGLPGPASLSTKHTLALTNRGTATAADLLGLAREIRDGVERTYGIRLVNEPVTVGCSL